MRRQRGDGEFRDMSVLLDEAGDAAQAEAGAEAVDEMGERGIVVGATARSWRRSRDSLEYRVAQIRNGAARQRGMLRAENPLYLEIHLNYVPRRKKFLA